MRYGISLSELLGHGGVVGASQRSAVLYTEYEQRRRCMQPPDTGKQAERYRWYTVASVVGCA